MRIGCSSRTAAGGSSLALVRDQDGGLAGFADDVGKNAVGARRSTARIDQKEHGVRLLYCRRGLRLHPRRKAFPLGIFEAGGVDDLEREIAEPRVTLAAVAGHTRLIIDQRQAAPDEPVEQRRFSDIRAAGDGDGKRHGESFAKDDRISRCRRQRGSMSPAA
jgi:hypothetical protein